MSTKSVIAVDQSLPIGLKANIAAVMGLSLGQVHPELLGDEVQSKDEMSFAGITNTPLPILETEALDLAGLYWAAKDEDIERWCFTDCALTTKNYDDYTKRCAETPSKNMQFHGVLLHGPKKKINKLCGNYPLLK